MGWLHRHSYSRPLSSPTLAMTAVAQVPHQKQKVGLTFIFPAVGSSPREQVPGRKDNADNSAESARDTKR